MMERFALKPLTGFGMESLSGGADALDLRYKFTRLAIEKLNVKLCSDYDYLNLGEYTFETSHISESTFTTNKKSGPAHTKTVKDALADAKAKYLK